VRSQVFAGEPAVAWAAACEFAQAKLKEGYTTVLLLTAESTLAKRYGLPAGAVMVRYWSKRSVSLK